MSREAVQFRFPQVSFAEALEIQMEQVEIYARLSAIVGLTLVPKQVEAVNRIFYGRLSSLLICCTLTRCLLKQEIRSIKTPLNN